MVNKRYVRGIAFVVLMLSAVLIAMAAPPTVTITTPASNDTRINGSFTFIATVTNTNENMATVYFNFTNGSWTNSVDLSSSSSPFSSTLDTTALADGNYSLEVNATNNNQTLPNSTTANRTFIVDNTPPSKVINLNATAIGQTYINLTWTDPSDADLDHLEVSFGSFSNILVAKGIQYYNTSSITTLASNTSYTFSVYTFDSTGNSNVTSITNTTFPNTVSDGPISLGSNVVVNFSGVTGSGNTSMAVSSSNTWGVSHASIFNAVGNYYDITTTANFAGGYAIVEVPYNPTGLDESRVRLYHLESGVWKDVTSGRNTGSDKVYGNVTSLSPFVPGVPPGPGITAQSPTDATFQTIGSISQNFTVTFNQTVDVTWYKNGTNVSSNTSVTSSSYFGTNPSTGTWNITVIGTNVNGTASYSWTWTVRPRTYATGNRIWDASKPDQFSLTYTWNPMSFPGFYYDIKNDVGNESIKITLNGYTSRTVSKGNIVYTTTPDTVNFGYSVFGSYQVIGFMAEKYFAGYTQNTTPPNPVPSTTFAGKSALGSGQLHKVLIDDDTKRTVSVGSTLTLQEGYVLKAKDIDLSARTMLISVLKDGNEVDSGTPLSAGQTYIYTKRVGSVSELPIIMVRFDSVFSGKEVQAAFLKGLFQISDNPTTVKSGDQFKDMKVRSVGQDKIEMSTDSDISLDKGNTKELMGDVKIIVADNDTMRFALSVEKTGTFEVRSTVYRGNDASPVDQWNPYNFGMNIGKTSVGFYYDLDDGIGNESLRFATPLTGRTISAQNLVYTTTPENVNFDYSVFGSYQVIGFMADKYFAGYTQNTTPPNPVPSTTFAGKSALGSGQLHKVLIDDDTKRTISVGSTLTLQEGYVLKAKDIDLSARTMLISVLKDGNEVDPGTPLSAGQTYIYTKRVGAVSELPIIMVRFDSVFSGKEVQAAFLRGLFQISDNPTKVKSGDQFKDMKVRSVGQDKIEMSNEGSISLDKNRIEELMGNIKLKVGDTTDDSLRFYFAVDVTPEMVANQLLIDAPAKATAGDPINVKVTAGGKAVDGASVSIGSSEIGKTDANGLFNYTLPRTMKGVQNITATKLGYQQTTRSMEILEYVDYRLSIDAPVKANQFESITVKVTYNSSAISGAALKYDNETIGATDNNGVLSYTLQTSGTHTISASKSGYITAVRDIEVRAPFSEYKAIDINIMPGVVFTNEPALIRSNITNAGTKADTRPVELIFNGTVAENRSVALAPGEIKEINFTWKEALPGNYTVEILGQKGLLEVREEPLNLLLIGGIATGFGAIIIYLLTAKSKISLEMLRQKLSGKFGKKAAEKAVEVVTPPKQ